MALSREQQERVNRLNQAFAQPRPNQRDGQFFRDTARQLGAGAAEIPTILAGAADTVAGLTGRDRPFSRMGSALAEATGVSPRAWGESLRESYSPALKRQQEQYESDWERAGERWQEGNRLGAVGSVVGGILTNPRAMTGMVAESLPASVIAGGAFGRAIKAAAPSISPMTAGALGQAPVFAGFTMSQIDEEVDPRRAALASLGVGIGAAAIAKFGADLSYRLGLIDPHTAMAGGLTAAVAPGTPQRSFAPRVALGGLAEGVLQDMPQEALEQMGKNWAEDKPLFQDVPRRSIDGLIAGTGMGAMFNIVSPPAGHMATEVDLNQKARESAESTAEPQALDRDELLDRYMRVSLLEMQFSDQQADYRQVAAQERQRLESLLIEQGESPRSLLDKQARATYQDLKRRVQFSEQQGIDAGIKRRRMSVLEEQFGLDTLAQPESWITDQIREREGAQSLFKKDGDLVSFAVTEYSRLMDMPPQILNEYLQAQVATLQAEQIMGRERPPLAPLYEVLAETLNIEPPRALPRPATGTPYQQSAIFEAEQSLQERAAEARRTLEAIDAAMERRQQEETQRRQAETQAQVESEVDADTLPPALRKVYDQQQVARQQRDFEFANAQQPQKQTVQYDADFDKAMDQIRAQRAQQEITDAEAALVMRDEAMRRQVIGTDVEQVITERRAAYQERQETAAFRKRLEQMTDSQFGAFKFEELGRRQRQPEVRPAQPTFEGFEAPKERPGLEKADPVMVERYKPYLQGLRSSLDSIEKGGYVYTDPATGEKKRTPHAQPEWYRERPVKTRTATAYKEVINRAMEDKPLALYQRRMLNYLYEVAEVSRESDAAFEAQIEQSIQEALAERAAVAAEAEAQQVAEPVADDIAFEFGEGIAAQQDVTPEAIFGTEPAPVAEPAPAPVAEPAPAPVAEPAPAPVAVQETPVGEQQAAPVQTSEQQPVASAPVRPAPTGIQTAVDPNVEIIRPKSKPGEPPKSYASERSARQQATRLNNQEFIRSLEPEYTYTAIKEGNDWVIRKEPVATQAAPEAVAEPVVPQAAPEAVAEPVAPQAAPEAVATPEAVAAPAPPRRRTPIPGITAVEAKQRINALMREAEFPNLSHILGSDWGANIAPTGWRNTEHYRAEAHLVADRVYGTQPQQEATPDAVQVREAAQVPAQPETQASQEVGEQVRQQAEVQQEVGDALETTFDALAEQTQALEQSPEAQGILLELVLSLRDSDRVSTTAYLTQIMDLAYEGRTGSVEGSGPEVRRMRNALDVMMNYDPSLFKDAILEMIPGRDTIPVTRTGKNDSPTTRFFRDIVKAGVIDAAAGKLTNVPKQGDQYARARELANKEKAPVGMSVSKADITDTIKFAREADARGQEVAPLAREQLSEDVDISTIPSVKEGVLSLSDYDMPGRTFVAENGADISAPLPVGRIRATIGVFTSKLRGAKPEIAIFANQADMRDKAPALYEQAKARFESGDFDTSGMAGYTFGDGKVLIFSDRIYTPKQLKFILAHETLGHFGMRSVFGNMRMNNLMDKVWHEAGEGSQLRNYVTKMQESYKDMTRQEAVEEFISDFAAVVDASLLQRVWDSLKSALNTFGVRFGDETARYMIYQSRRYVRGRGIRLDADGSLVKQTRNDLYESPGHEVTVEKIASDMRGIENMTDPGMVGRAYRADDTLGYIHHVIGQDIGSRSYDHSDVQTWINKVKDSGTGLANFGKRAINEIRTMNYNARDNRGYKEFFRIMSSTVNYAISLRTKYNNNMQILMNPAAKIPGGPELTKGITEKQLQYTGQMAIDSTLAAFSKLENEGVIRQRDASEPLVVMIDGKVEPNKAVIEKMKTKARITPKQFAKGFTYTVNEVQPISPQKRAALEAELASDDTPKKRKTEIRNDLESGATTVKVERKVEPRPDITADSIEYKAYIEAQDVMAEKAIDLLMANYEAAAGERVIIENIIADAIGRPLTNKDKAFLEKLESNYVAVREEKMTYNESGEVQYNLDSIYNGEKFLEMFNRALLSSDDAHFLQDVKKVKTYLRNMPFDDFVADMQEFRKDAQRVRHLDDNGKYIIQHRVADLAFFEMRKNDAELLAKRTIMGNYIPLGRDGRFQVRMQALDRNGNEVAISKRQRAQLIYMQLNNQGEGQRTADEITQTLKDASKEGDGFFELEIHKDGKRVLEPVQLVARLEAARTKPGIHSEVNLNEVLSTLSQFNVQLTPKERASITVGLTQQNAKARTRLRREGTPGYDVKNWTKYLSQDLESAASVIARRKHRHLLDEVLDVTRSKTAELWYGNHGKYNQLKERYEQLSNDPNADAHAIDAAKREFIDYHYTFVVKDSQKNANHMLDRAQMDLSFLEEQTSVEYTDFASGDLASRIRMWTTFAQLGMSAATAALNILALGTNVMPFLSAYNQKNNFGGGFGVANSVSEMVRTLKSVGIHGERAFAPFYDKLLDGYNFKEPDSTAPEHLAAKKRLDAEGLKADEAAFLRKQIQAGVMQAALFNAMLGSARGRITSGLAQRAAGGWMYMFSHSEQAARRITGLAAYRLARDRGLKAGKGAEAAMAEAESFAVNAINDTLGEYAMFNRPSLFRGGVQQFIFMYKMFPLTSVLLFSQMDKKGKLLMVGMLMLLSGAKGLPLGEDLMDIIDTIAQRAGLGPRGVWKGSAEKTVLDFFESIAPGMGKYMMRGFVNNHMPINLSDRTSLGNLIPGTGIGLYGANAGREALEVAGPFASFIADSAGTVGRVAEFAAGKAGIRPHTTTGMDILRTAPFTMLRAAGDTIAYNQHGSIINQRGQIISEDMHLGVTIGRLLGFYPSSAVKHYDVIRMMSRMDNFQKQIVALHRQRWIKAKLMGDHETAQEIVQQIRDWNVTARGTEFEIRNFVPNSFRALQTARLTATERYKKSSPIAQRRHIDDMMELMGATD